MALERSNRPRRLRRSSAFTLVEVCVAGAVLAIALSALVGSMVTSMSLHRVNHETALAQQGARRALEELQAVPFREVFAAYDAYSGDDAGLSVVARGAAFAVAGLSAPPGDADGLCGEVLFPVTLVGGVPELREDVVDAELGLPRDLNGDGLVDALDHSADYVLLPVRVRVAWRGVTGDPAVDFCTVLCAR